MRDTACKEGIIIPRYAHRNYGAVGNQTGDLGTGSSEPSLPREHNSPLNLCTCDL